VDSSPPDVWTPPRAPAPLRPTEHAGGRATSLRQLLAFIVAGCALACALDHGTVTAQQRLLVIGTVQWVTATRMQVMTDASVSVSVDLSRLDQGSYPLLRPGDRVNVVGVVSPERNRLIAESIEPGAPGGGYWNLFPEAP